MLIKNAIRFLLVLVSLVAKSGLAQLSVCDVDSDGDIDTTDIEAIVAARNTSADGDEDPRDADGNGVINLLDARQCVLRCTLTDCTANVPPVADAGPDQQVFFGETVILDGSGSSDADGDALTFRWFFITVPLGSTAMLSNPTAVMPTFSVDVSGTYVVELVVNDGVTDSKPDTVTITTGNTPPVADAGPNQSIMLALDESDSVIPVTVMLDGSGSTDVDGDPLTFQWALTSVPEGSEAMLNNPNSVRPNFMADVPGTYEAELVVDDGQVNSAPDTVIISTENIPPVADAGPDQFIELEAVDGPAEQEVMLDGSGSTDADGDPLTFEWSLTSVPEGSDATLSDSTAVMPTFVVDLGGADAVYVAQLIVNDGLVDSEPDTIMVSANTRPVAEAGPDQAVMGDEAVMLDGSDSFDPDGDDLSFQWSLTSKPAGSMAVLMDSMTATPSFLPDVVGEDAVYVAQLTVSDGLLDSTDTVTIAANTRPVADAGPDQIVILGDSVTLDGSKSFDPDGDDLSFEWSFTSTPPGSDPMLDDSTAEMPSFVADTVGMYVAQLIVSDGRLDSAPDTVTIQVNGADLVALDKGSQEEQFCQFTEGGFLVSVQNQGAGTAPASVTRVVFSTTGGDVPMDLATPALLPSESVDLEPINLPEGCFIPDCNFDITVDVDDDVPETDEMNTFNGICFE